MKLRKRNIGSEGSTLGGGCFCVAKCSGIQCWNEGTYQDTNYRHLQISMRYSSNTTVTPWNSPDLLSGN